MDQYGSILGTNLSQWFHGTFQLHKMLQLDGDKNLSIWVIISRISGVIIFLVIMFWTLRVIVIMFWTLRVRPKLLGLSDYFIALFLVTLITVNVIDLSGYTFTNSLTHIQLWLLFKLMIFGIEYKTITSFLGFIRPRKASANASIVSISICMILGFVSVI